jgi:hypothetical protein
LNPKKPSGLTRLLVQAHNARPRAARASTDRQLWRAALGSSIVRTAIVSIVVGTGVAALLAAWAVSSAFSADDGSKPLFEAVFVVCGVACFVLAGLIWRRSRPPTPS